MIDNVGMNVPTNQAVEVVVNVLQRIVHNKEESVLSYCPYFGYWW